jgi:hypothetical protein
MRIIGNLHLDDRPAPGRAIAGRSQMGGKIQGNPCRRGAAGVSYRSVAGGRQAVGWLNVPFFHTETGGVFRFR